MGISHSEAYAAAGVDIEAGYQGVKMMNRYVQRTLTADVISDLGGFGGLFSLDLHGLEKPVLVSGTDGVGTKQRIAQLMDRHNTVGIDCVAMCVNDIICCGAKPLFFLDYIAIGKNIPEKVVSLVSGVSEGCVRAGCALIGGETAEHPGTMKPDDYDLAGFAVGVVDRDKILDKNKMQPGDVVIALPSSGLHSNGYSLVRKVFDVENADLGQYYGELGCALGEELLRPTKIYVRPVLAAIEAADIVLMDDAPSKLSLAVRLSRRTMKIVWQNVIFALAVKALVLVLGATGDANMWIAVFADVGVLVLAILNAMRALLVPKH